MRVVYAECMNINYGYLHCPNHVGTKDYLTSCNPDENCELKGDYFRRCLFVWFQVKEEEFTRIKVEDHNNY